MLLEVELPVFAATDHVPVIVLLDMLAKGRHDWRPTLPIALRADQFVAKLNGSELKAPALAEWARKSVEEAANPRVAAAPSVVVTAGDLHPMVEDLAREAVVVVEDGFSDECFLLAVAAAFGRYRIVAAADCKRRWLRFAHAGGKGRMYRFVVKERGPFNIVVRVGALLDSDRTTPAQRSPNHDQMTKILAVDGVTAVHMWDWREVENYVPTRAWDDHFPNRGAQIKSIRALPLAQRGYLDIKRELGRRMPSPLIPDDLVLTEDDFAELGPDAVAELKAFLAMIERIL
jgi:hypothetical protein